LERLEKGSNLKKPDIQASLLFRRNAAVIGACVLAARKDFSFFVGI
jgi:hypothetical protein